MKKIVRMSLVAAVAVAGLTTVNAQPLEEAIKNVEVSGSVGYRYDDFGQDNGNSSTTNKYKIALNVSSKVNDDVKVHTRFIVGGGNNGYANLNTQEGADVQVNVALTNVYFGYTGIKNTTVNIGKQGVPTPWTVAQATGGSDASEQTGTGILALSTWGPVTVAAAYFNQTNLGESGDISIALAGIVGTAAVGSTNLTTVGVLGNAGPVALDAWYLGADDVFDSYTVGAKASFNAGSVKLGVDARYTVLELEDTIATALGRTGVEDNSLAKIMLTAKAGIFNAGYTFGMTDKDGGITAVDNDAATTINGWAVTLNNKTDADLHRLVVGAQVMDKLHIGAIYTTIDYEAGANDNSTDEEAILAITYKMSKNLTTTVMLSQNERDNLNGNDNVDEDRGRLEVVYTF